jgi:RND family efflux transporter MFP subunit
VSSPDTNGRHKRWWAAIAGSVGFCLVGLLLAPGLIRKQPTPVPEPTAQEAPIAAPVRESAESATPPEQPIGGDSPRLTTSHDFDCMISPSESIQIGSSILGVIEQIHVERSDFVEAGQLLATLESSVEAAAVRIAKARADRTVELESTRVSLRLGEKRRSRAVGLHEKNSQSLDIRQEIETETQLAELAVLQAEEYHHHAALQLEQARATLARRTIRSPISGFVVERLMSPGEVVDEETLMTIAQVDPLRVDVILPSHLFGSVELGDSVEVVPEPPLDQPRIAKVEIVDRVLDGASGTFGIRLLLPNPDHEVPGGLRCLARVITSGVDLASADQPADPK